MIDDGLGYSLAPRNDAIERLMGQQIGGVGPSDGGVDWAFGRKWGLGLRPGRVTTRLFPITSEGFPNLPPEEV